LEEENGSLRGASPHQLATFTLTVLNVNVTAGIFQAAILENAINEDGFVKNNVLVFEGFVLVPVHG